MTPHFVSVNNRTPTSYLHALLSVGIAEWKILLRMHSRVTFVALFAAVAVLLTPGIDAPYAVLTVQGKRMAMNADTTLIAAASVLALLLMPVQFLNFSVGVRRDLQWGLMPIHVAASLPRAGLNLGRITARVVVLCVDTVVILMLLSLAIVIRHHSMPGITALTVFMLILIPAGLAAFAVGIVIDGLLGNLTVRVWIAFSAWCGVMLMTILGGLDLIGYGLLSVNLANGRGPVPVSLGLSPASGLGIAVWRTLIIPSGWLSGQVFLLFACCAVVYASGLLLRWTHPARGALIHHDAVAASAPALSLVPVLVNTQRTLLLHPLALIARRLIRRRGISFTVLTAIAMLPALGAPKNLAPAAVLLMPIILLNGRTPETSLANVMVLPTLWRPTPNVLVLIALASLMLPALLPCLLVSPVAQSMQMALACLLAAAWFIFCNNILCRPQLSQAVLILAWFVFAVNTPPAGFDLIGTSAGHPAIAAILASLNLILISMIAVGDRFRKR